MPRVIHFEINAANPERARTFYEHVFGWKFQRWEGPMDYWLITTGENGQPGIDGGLTGQGSPSGHVNTIDVPSVDEYTNKVVAAGGQVTVHKMAIPGVGYMAYCTDTEGGIFGVLEANESAS